MGKHSAQLTGRRRAKRPVFRLATDTLTFPAPVEPVAVLPAVGRHAEPTTITLARSPRTAPLAAGALALSMAAGLIVAPPVVAPEMTVQASATEPHALLRDEVIDRQTEAEATARILLAAEFTSTQQQRADAAVRAAAAKAAAAQAAERAQEAVNRATTRPPVPSRSSSPAAAVAVRNALAQIGKPYVWGAAGPSSFDCSGLVQYAFRLAGISLPRTSRAQSTAGRPVSAGDLQPGDLVFYYRPVSHVAIYIGNGRVVEAPNFGMTVQVMSLTWAGQPVAYRRVA